MIHPDFSHSDFIITPRDLLWLMIERDKRVREKVHGENKVTEDAPTPQNESQNFLPSRRKGVAGGT